MIFDMSLNSQFIKGIKIVKLVKLLRMIRIDFKIVSLDELARNEYAKEIVQLFRRNIGFLNLLKNNFMIVFASHYYTVF